MTMNCSFLLSHWRSWVASWFRWRSQPWLLLLLFLMTPLLIVGLPWATPSVSLAQQPQREVRGVWLTSNDSNLLRDRSQTQNIVQQLAQLKLNTLYPVIWNSGYVLYPSAVAEREGIQPFVLKGLQGQDPLADLISQAHQQNLLVIPWFEFGFMAPPTSELAINHPDWLTQKRNGEQTSISAAGEVVWLNPFLPQVQKFITDLVLEAISQYDVDGIQFDDHMSLPSEFGYDPYTVNLYRQETKKEPHPDFQNPEWVRWRADKLTAFMGQLQQAIKARKSNAIVSVSPAPYDFAYRSQLQDWLDWVNKNLVDELVVQVYRYELQHFLNQIDRPEIRAAQAKIPTAIGVLTGLRTRSVPIALVQEKVRAARDRGLGVAFFYLETLWNDARESAAMRQSALQALFP